MDSRAGGLDIKGVRAGADLGHIQRHLDGGDVARSGIDGEAYFTLDLNGAGLGAEKEFRGPAFGAVLFEAFGRIDTHEGVEHIA